MIWLRPATQSTHWLRTSMWQHFPAIGEKNIVRHLDIHKISLLVNQILEILQDIHALQSFVNEEQVFISGVGSKSRRLRILFSVSQFLSLQGWITIGKKILPQFAVAQWSAAGAQVCLSRAVASNVTTPGLIRLVWVTITYLKFCEKWMMLKRKNEPKRRTSRSAAFPKGRRPNAHSHSMFAMQICGTPMLARLV